MPERVALITGAGSPEGIGFACARAMASAGYAVAVAATTERIHARARELDAAGATARGYIADLTDRDAVDRLAAAIGAELGPPSVLINNAGMAQTGHELPEDAPVHTIDPAVWDRKIAITLTTAFNVTRVFTPAMIDAGWGRIVTVSSVTGPLVTVAGHAPYATAKAALEGLTKTLAVELGPHGITANTVAPGWIATASSSPAELRAGEFTPLGRPGTAAEVAACVAFLASPEASYVTGHMLVVDGGNTLQEDHAHGR